MIFSVFISFLVQADHSLLFLSHDSRKIGFAVIVILGIVPCGTRGRSGFGCNKIEVTLDAVAQALRQRQPCIAERGQHRLSHHPHFFVRNTLEKLFFRPEVIMQHCVGHACGRGD